MSVLRPACLSDIQFIVNLDYREPFDVACEFVRQAHDRMNALTTLYDAEWQKRGYRRSP